MKHQLKKTFILSTALLLILSVFGCSGKKHRGSGTTPKSESDKTIKTKNKNFQTNKSDKPSGLDDNSLVAVSSRDTQFLIPKAFAATLFNIDDDVESGGDEEKFITIYNQKAALKITDPAFSGALQLPEGIFTYYINAEFLCFPKSSAGKCTYGNLEKLKSAIKTPVMLNIYGMDKNFPFEKLNGLKIYLNLSGYEKSDFDFDKVLQIKTLQGITLPPGTPSPKLISELALLPGLKYLGIRKTNITKKTAELLTNLKRLNHLYFNNLYFEPGALKILSALNLDILEIPSCGRMFSVELKDFSGLKWLNVRNANFAGEEGNPDDIFLEAFVKTLKNIEKADFQGILQIKSLLKLLLSWKNLKYVSFAGIDLQSEIKMLSNIKTLKYMDLRDTNIDCKQVSELKKLIPGLHIQISPGFNREVCND